LGGFWALEWACHSAETNLRCAEISGNCMRDPRSQRSYGQTDRRSDGQTDMARSTIRYPLLS